MPQKEPWYDCEYDTECECTASKIESSWEWDEDQECWVCSSCGSMQ